MYFGNVPTSTLMSAQLDSKGNLAGGNMWSGSQSFSGNVICNTGVWAYRPAVNSGNDGVVYLNSAANRYLHWDGTNYNLPGADLYVNGQAVNATLASKANAFNPAFTGQPTLTGLAPQMQFADTDWGNRYLHNNGGLIGFLTHAGAWAWYSNNDGTTSQSGNAVIGSATYYTDGNIYMPWAANYLSNVINAKAAIGGTAFTGGCSFPTVTINPGFTTTALYIGTAGYHHCQTGTTNHYLDRTAGSGQIVEYRRMGAGVGGVTVGSSSTTFNTTSDVRLKEDFQEWTGVDEFFDNVKVYDFAWKADGSRAIGCVAQELYQLEPRAVDVGETVQGPSRTKPAKDGKGPPIETIERHWGVDYSKMVPHSIVGIQKLRAENKALKSTVDTLVAEIQSLSQRLAALESAS